MTEAAGHTDTRAALLMADLHLREGRLGLAARAAHQARAWAGQHRDGYLLARSHRQHLTSLSAALYESGSHEQGDRNSQEALRLAGSRLGRSGTRPRRSVPSAHPGTDNDRPNGSTGSDGGTGSRTSVIDDRYGDGG